MLSESVEDLRAIVRAQAARIAQLEQELFEAEEAEDHERAFAVRRVDELIAIHRWKPGVSELFQ